MLSDSEPRRFTGFAIYLAKGESWRNFCHTLLLSHHWRVLQGVQVFWAWAPRMRTKNAKCTNCRPALGSRPQFFHSRRFFCSHAKLRSTSQRWGATANLVFSKPAPAGCHPHVARSRRQSGNAPCATGEILRGPCATANHLWAGTAPHKTPRTDPSPGIGFCGYALQQGLGRGWAAWNCPRLVALGQLFPFPSRLGFAHPAKTLNTL